MCEDHHGTWLFRTGKDREARRHQSKPCGNPHYHHVVDAIFKEMMIQRAQASQCLVVCTHIRELLVVCGHKRQHHQQFFGNDRRCGVGLDIRPEKQSTEPARLNALGAGDGEYKR